METSLYTWQTAGGDLSIVVRGNNNYDLLLKTGTDTVRIAPNRIEGVPELTSLADKVDTFFLSYFPVVQIVNEQFSVIFYESATMDDGEALKDNLGAFTANKCEKKVLIPFSSKAPTYRRVIQGLNLQAICNHQGCLAQGRAIFIPVGIGKYSIPRLAYESKCPSCHNIVAGEAIKNLGFWKCTYTIDGRQKTEPEETVVNKTETAESARYTTFDMGDDVTWTYLDIETKTTGTKNSRSTAPSKSGNCQLF